jgi:hypothetical protein
MEKAVIIYEEFYLLGYSGEQSDKSNGYFRAELST